MRVHSLLKPEYVDGFNIGLIIFSCVLAHLIPYRLFLISYSVLGSAHYLTQISWMHDKNYFIEAEHFAPLCIILTALLVLSPGLNFSAVLLSSTLTGVLAFVLAARRSVIVLFFLIGAAAGYILVRYVDKVAIFFATLLPTVIHVFVFTACFMWIGALKTGRRSAYAALFVLLIGAASFLVSGETQPPPPLVAFTFFQQGASYIQSLMPRYISEARIFGFLSFVYTYHYLNWFAKAEVIRWNQIPRRRLYVIVAMYLGILGIYAYSYIDGFILSVALSLLHVLMELPLNLRTFAGIASAYVAGGKSPVQSKPS